MQLIMVNRFSKPKISIQLIGAQRFWGSLMIGVLVAVVLSFFFSYSRECLRYFITGERSDLLILSNADHWFWNLFYSATSVSLGLSMTVYGWLSNRIHHRSKDRRYRSFGRLLILVNFWFVLYALSRFGSILSWVQGMRSYDDHLDLIGEFGSALVLIPLLTFLLSWTSLRSVYRLTGLRPISMGSSALLILALAWISHLDPEQRNRAYLSRYADYFEFLDSEVARAKSQYGLDFDEGAIAVMKKRYTERSNEQLRQLKSAFEPEAAVTMKEILLQGMAVKTMKGVDCSSDPQTSLEEWQFASPQSVVEQLSKFDPYCHESQELMGLLQKQIELWNFDSEKIIEGSIGSELNWFHYARCRVPIEAIDRLQLIRDSLLTDDRYVELATTLPEIVRLSDDDEE